LVYSILLQLLKSNVISIKQFAKLNLIYYYYYFIIVSHHYCL